MELDLKGRLLKEVVDRRKKEERRQWSRTRGSCSKHSFSITLYIIPTSISYMRNIILIDWAYARSISSFWSVPSVDGFGNSMYEGSFDVALSLNDYEAMSREKLEKENQEQGKELFKSKYSSPPLSLSPFPFLNPSSISHSLLKHFQNRNLSQSGYLKEQ